ncbi:hypothetical protein FHS77_001371 [Paenochrobactrum gallinarii]|uniref:DUF2059 domain-containing protein n=1 Tax=Paenochrobactrum gallinarii TaxID=643673 RepID=A0A841LVD5_9HYPH|nr:hypothetical protein [Paenochrobactrum gallinarii]MBB6260830.1 hypothetical protein [Paenochrobactrum gallinarii]
MLKKSFLLHVFTALTLTTTSMTALPLTAQAQSFSEVAPPPVPAEVNAFKLTPEFLSKMEAVQTSLSGLDQSAMPEPDSEVEPTIAMLIKGVEAKPEIMAVLNQHELSASDYITGYFALMSGLAGAEAEDEEQMVDELKDINPEHVEFAKTYQERILQLLGE